MPTLDGIINRDVMGNLATLSQILSLMLWNFFATGKFADKHGIPGLIEPDPVNSGAQPYTSLRAMQSPLEHSSSMGPAQ